MQEYLHVHTYGGTCSIGSWIAFHYPSSLVCFFNALFNGKLMVGYRLDDALLDVAKEC